MTELEAAIASSEHTTALLRAMQPSPPVVVPPAGELWTRYNSAYFGVHTYPIVGVDAASRPGVPPVHGEPFTSSFVNIVTWGTVDEHHGLIVNNGEAWGALLFYGDHNNPSIAYPEEVLQCDWINLDTNTNRDMSKFTSGPVGGIMCPQNLPVSGNYRLRQWGWVWNAPKDKGGVRDHQFYWQCDYLFGSSIPNFAWTGPGDNIRPGIKYSEAWWDSVNKWEPTTATSPDDPWKGGVPTIPNVTYLGWRAFGKDAGTLWRNDYGAYKVAQSGWTA
jgi:hypothetical protein